MLKEILLLSLLLNYHKIVQGKPAPSEIQVFDEISKNVNVFTEKINEIVTKEVDQIEGNLTKNDWTKPFKGLWNSMVSNFKSIQNRVQEGFKNFVTLLNLG